MRHGPTITSGQDKDGWRQGLEQAGVTAGNVRHINPTSNITGGAAGSHMMPVESSWPSIKVADRLLGQAPEFQQQRSVEPISGSVNSSVERVDCGNVHATRGGGHQLEGSQGTDGNGENDNDEDFSVSEEFSDYKSTKLGVRKGKKKGKERRKVGRPVAYKGDPEDPGLTEKDKRRIKRRIANRESAQRVRHRRQEELEEMQLKMDQVVEENTQLREQVDANLAQRNQLAGELEELRGRYRAVAAQNTNMDAEVKALRQCVQLKMSDLESELDRQEAAANAAPPAPGSYSEGMASAFGTTTIKRDPSFLALSQAPGSQPFASGLTASLEMKGSQGALDWFPSLNIEGIKSMDMDLLLESYNNLSNNVVA